MQNPNPNLTPSDPPLLALTEPVPNAALQTRIKRFNNELLSSELRIFGSCFYMQSTVMHSYFALDQKILKFQFQIFLY